MYASPYRPKSTSLLQQFGFHFNSIYFRVKDLGVIIDNKLSFSNHCSQICAKARQRPGLVFKTFITRDPVSLCKAYVTYVCLLLEYCTSVWNLHLHKYINLIESVQHNFTYRLFACCQLPYMQYTDRLNYLNIESLQYRRCISDQLMLYNIVCKFYSTSLFNDIDFSTETRTRGHSLKIFVKRCKLDVYKFSFLNRTINLRNSLPESVVCSNVINAFLLKLHACYLIQR